jgi:hypothetical protein
VENVLEEDRAAAGGLADMDVQIEKQGVVVLRTATINAAFEPPTNHHHEKGCP